jgi:hypothetical protein
MLLKLMVSGELERAQRARPARERVLVEGEIKDRCEV